MIRSATNEEILNWDQLILKNPDHGHLYQSFLWGEYKSGYDWRPHRLIWEDGDSRVAIQAIAKQATGFGTLWYTPKGPGMFAGYSPEKADAARFKQFTKELTDYISKHDPRAFMIMVDPELFDGSFAPQKAGWKKSHHDLQF
ncbi:MAG: peptidoglycan bridge formation glycyltransferase FemA/FemB family protein, partial [Candidatus Saccharibacteria bacterium]